MKKTIYKCAILASALYAPSILASSSTATQIRINCIGDVAALMQCVLSIRGCDVTAIEDRKVTMKDAWGYGVSTYKMFEQCFFNAMMYPFIANYWSDEGDENVKALREWVKNNITSPGNYEEFLAFLSSVDLCLEEAAMLGWGNEQERDCASHFNMRVFSYLSSVAPSCVLSYKQNEYFLAQSSALCMFAPHIVRLCEQIYHTLSQRRANREMEDMSGCFAAAHEVYLLFKDLNEDECKKYDEEYFSRMSNRLMHEQYGDISVLDFVKICYDPLLFFNSGDGWLFFDLLSVEGMQSLVDNLFAVLSTNVLEHDKALSAFRSGVFRAYIGNKDAEHLKVLLLLLNDKLQAYSSQDYLKFRCSAMIKFLESLSPLVDTSKNAVDRFGYIASYVKDNSDFFNEEKNAYCMIMEVTSLLQMVKSDLCADEDGKNEATEFKKLLDSLDNSIQKDLIDDIKAFDTKVYDFIKEQKTDAQCKTGVVLQRIVDMITSRIAEVKNEITALQTEKTQIDQNQNGAGNDHTKSTMSSQSVPDNATDLETQLQAPTPPASSTPNTQSGWSTSKKVIFWLLLGLSIASFGVGLVFISKMMIMLSAFSFGGVGALGTVLIGTLW